MTTFPAANYWSNASRTEAEQKTFGEDFLATTKQLPGGGPQSTLTLASDAITPTAGFHLVDTQAAASTDDLSTITQTNLPDGSWLMLGLANAAHNVVLKHNVGGTGKLAMVNGADLTLDLTGTYVLFQRNGTSWEERGRFYGFDAAGHRLFYGTPGFGQNTWTGRQEEKKGADIASAGSLPLGTDGNYFHVTGTTTITSLSTAPAGTEVTLCFDGSLQITHNATSLILPGGSNIQTAAGIVLKFRSEGSGNWRMVAGASDYATILDRVTANTTVTNTAAETTIYTFSVPGGTLGAARRLKLRLQLSLVDSGGAAAAVFVTFRLKYGATTVATFRVQTTGYDGVTAEPVANGTVLGYLFDALLSADGATNAQIGTLGWSGPQTLTTTLTPANLLGIPVGGVAFEGRGTAAEDSTAAKNLVITAQWSAATSGRTVVMEHATLVRE